jgi:hypothetical protein
MVARLQSYIELAPTGGGPGSAQRNDLRVLSAGARVPALADNRAVACHDRPD